MRVNERELPHSCVGDQCLLCFLLLVFHFVSQPRFYSGANQILVHVCDNGRPLVNNCVLLTSRKQHNFLVEKIIKILSAR